MVEDLYWLIARVVPLLKEFVARAHDIGDPNRSCLQSVPVDTN